MVVSGCIWCADLFVGQHFCSFWHQAVWVDGWDSCWRWLCSPGCGFVPVLLWGDFVVSLSDDGRADIIGAFGTFLDLHLSISGGVVSAKIYGWRDDFGFEIVNFPFLDGDVPRSTSYGVYISQLICFAGASGCVADFNTRNKSLIKKLLKQGYRYHKLRITFSKFYRRYYDLISKFQVGFGSLLHQGLLEPDFYVDLVCKLKTIVGSNSFFSAVYKIVSHYKDIGYNISVLQQTACLVVNSITVVNFAFLFNCTPVGRTSDSMMVSI